MSMDFVGYTALMPDLPEDFNGIRTYRDGVKQYVRNRVIEWIDQDPSSRSQVFEDCRNAIEYWRKKYQQEGLVGLVEGHDASWTTLETLPQYITNLSTEELLEGEELNPKLPESLREALEGDNPVTNEQTMCFIIECVDLAFHAILETQVTYRIPDSVITDDGWIFKPRLVVIAGEWTWGDPADVPGVNELERLGRVAKLLPEALGIYF